MDIGLNLEAVRCHFILGRMVIVAFSRNISLQVCMMD